MRTVVKRRYDSSRRDASAARTRSKVLDAGKFLFSRHGIDATTIAQIAERAGVSTATVYATVKSKSGLLHALIHDAIFGPRFQDAQKKLAALIETGRAARIANAPATPPSPPAAA